MKLRKMLSKILVLSIIATTAAMPLVTFADETANTQEIREERNPFEEREKADPQTRVLELVSEYTPESLTQWESLFQSKDLLKAEVDVLKSEIQVILESNRASIKDSSKIEKEIFINDLKSKVESGEITREEASAIFISEKDSRTTNRDTLKAEREAIKQSRLEERALKQTEKQNTRELLKLAVTDENATEIINILNTMLSANLDKVEKTNAHIIQLQEKLAELNSL